MAKLTAAKRKKLPSKDFAGPGRSYPVNDKNHAVAAKGRATQAVKAGRMSPVEKKKIVSKADNKLRTVGKHALPPTGRY